MPSQKVRDLTDIRNGSDEVRTHNHHHEDGACCCGHHHHEHGDECGHEHSYEPEHKHGHDEACGCGEAHTHEGHEHDACCGKEHEHHHHADEVFTSWGVETGKSFTREDLEKKLAALASGKFGQVLRAKGIVDGGDVWYHFDYVPGEPDVRTGSAAVTGRLCVIGCKLDEDALQTLFLG